MSTRTRRRRLAKARRRLRLQKTQIAHSTYPYWQRQGLQVHTQEDIADAMNRVFNAAAKGVQS